VGLRSNAAPSCASSRRRSSEIVRALAVPELGQLAIAGIWLVERAFNVAILPMAA